jgi:3-methyl-2-oxobutanoate hydroxymethyltransferase
VRTTPDHVRGWKGRHPRPLSVTTYDYAFARLLDEAGVDILHVGDTLGMMVLGHPDTTEVTMDDMAHHTRAVARANPRALITADLPIHSYDTPKDAIANGRRLIEAGADAVKVEGCSEIEEQVLLMRAEGIPIQGHLGMLPQHVKEEGGYKRKGKTAAERDRLVREAQWLEGAGCFSLVLECVVAEVADEITRSVSIPTFGIASGTGCDGEIRVAHDLFGMFPWFVPPFVVPVLDVATGVKEGITRFRGTMG